jgi:hypothetical protein
MSEKDRRTGETDAFRIPEEGAKSKSGQKPKAPEPKVSRSGVGAAHRLQSTDVRQKRKFKEFRLTSFAVDHPTSVFVMTLIVVIAGLGSYLAVPKESMPEIVIPNIIVNTIYPGVAPGDIETLLTEPLEDELNTITDIKTITSVSAEGRHREARAAARS